MPVRRSFCGGGLGQWGYSVEDSDYQDVSTDEPICRSLRLGLVPDLPELLAKYAFKAK